MTASFAPRLSHFGMFCRDIDAQAAFYRQVFGMVETDRGQGITFRMDLVFLSSSPEQHHQLALASGRAADGPSTVMQLSFKVDTLDQLREARRRALAHGAMKLRGLNHGNALSIYFSDPEDNTVEVYLDTPWYVTQPHGDALDLDRPDEEIWAETERACRADPSFAPADEWRRATFGPRPA
ncbi:VOC family protein [Aquincola sp. S2]|uniref:VOC family protein n=1 Tax=Pseudaquabacterium terrae TaxID=2732868 RepID=A0ABX2EGJ6_9BURK|nr:VOC family protein [Aquabacterium terrae]NRF67723.1 VOC family protein [Aquabacterium terrae]